MRGYVIISLTLCDYFLCLNCRESDRTTREFVSKSEKVKNRSPNVWRNKLVLNVHGPTISSAGIKHMVQA